jgi:hypothetical protein
VPAVCGRKARALAARLAKDCQKRHADNNQDRDRQKYVCATTVLGVAVIVRIFLVALHGGAFQQQRPRCSVTGIRYGTMPLPA